MTVARPFRALRYDTSRVELSKVIVPPYDVIAADERAAFFDRDPHNAIRFELTRDVADEAGTDYSEIAQTLASWRRSGVLVQESEPAYYVMRQRFTGPDGRRVEREGFFAELALAEYSEGVVRPHERTLAGPKADRLKLLRASRANLSSVFLLYEDRERASSRLLAQAFDVAHGGCLLGEARDDAGVEYSLARLAQPEAVAALRALLAERPTVIADGHHRYETALDYLHEKRRELHEKRGEPRAGARAEAPWESTLAYFANAYAPGTLLLPIHRVIREVPAPSDAQWSARLPGWQSRTLPLSGAGEIAARLAEGLAPLAAQPCFAADDGSGVLRIFWREQPLAGDLMVRVLENDVIGPVFGLSPAAIRDGAVGFPKSAERAAREVREGQGTVALYLNALSAEDVFRVTAAGEVMPQKSTFFYPKVPTGMVFRLHEEAP